MRLDQKYKPLLDRYGINTPLRVAHAMAQLEHESGLKPISENLSYSAKGLGTTFKKYFPTVILCNKYANQPQRIANIVYANRMGNGSVNSGEGWKYRGRGFIQITGKENYFRLHIDTDLDCVKNPDLLLIEENAMLSACWFWKLKGLNSLADKDDIVSITKRVNGGLFGLEHRKELLKKWKLTLNI